MANIAGTARPDNVPARGGHPTLVEPVEIAKFWKSRRRDIAVVVAIGPYKEHNLISVREHVVGSDGIMRPSTRGVSLVVRRLPELAAALAKALVRARELLADDGGEI
jgi:hypothetical protein